MKLLNRLLDGSILFSFDVHGFRRHAKQFAADDLDHSLEGKAALITGANSGIGFASAKALMQRGCHVVMVSRNEGRAKNAAEELRKLAPEGSVEYRIADISSLRQVRDLSESALPELAILVHNAGDMVPELLRSEEGHETITATHVLGPYLLTTRLLEIGLLKGSPEDPPRVIFVSSGGMYSQPLDVDVLKNPELPYDGMVHYAQTKRAQVVLAQALQERQHKEAVFYCSMHPGWVDTPAVRRAMPRFYRTMGKILRNPEQGSDTVVWLAMAPFSKLESPGGFYFDRKIAPMHMLSKTRKGDGANSLLEYIEGAQGIREA